MLIKTLHVEVLPESFPAGVAPTELASSPVNIDVNAALVMVGTIAIPGGFSSASPARFWAWLRYFSAVATSPDLRIVGPFVDLDPHQRGILSDDFGVAFCTQWLVDRVGGFREIVDGRRFLLHYSSLINPPPVTKKPPKVGIGKCPDFVVQDKAGRWHVLECKGTQSGKRTRESQLKTALEQKTVIKISGAMVGHQLAAGLSLANDRGGAASSIRVVDPDREPLVTIKDNDISRATAAIRRVATARAFGLAGMDRLAEELALPAQRQDWLTRLYLPGELRRLKTPVLDRAAAALDQAIERPLTEFQDAGVTYLGRQVTMEVPGEAFLANTGFRQVVVRQGVNAAVVNAVRSAPPDSHVVERVEEIAKPFLQTHEGLVTTSEPNRISLRDGELFEVEVEFK